MAFIADHLQTVEDLLREASGVGRRFHHQWRYRGNQHSLGGSALAMPCEIAHHFTSARRMADVDRVSQIEMGRQGREIVGVMIGTIMGRDIEVTDAETVPLPVPTQAEIIIEGYVHFAAQKVGAVTSPSM